MVVVYDDYELRILNEKRQQADDARRGLFLKLSKVRDETREARRTLDSWQRANKLLARATSDNGKRSCQEILNNYLSEDQLIARLEAAVEDEKETQLAFDKARIAYTHARDKAAEQRKLNVWINREFIHYLAKELFARFGKVELVCRYDRKKNELNVYFGGRECPIGTGHAHWVFTKTKGLVYRRDPGKKR